MAGKQNLSDFRRIPMPTNGDSLAGRVQASYLQLSAVASDLNAISDELGQSVSEIDAALKKLNLGISVWVEIHSSTDDDLDYYRESVGYAKVDGKWGIALTTESGNHNYVDQDKVEQWLFNDGPRKLRLDAIEKLPEVLKNLSEEAVRTTDKIKSRLAEAKEVAAAVKNAAEPPKKRVFSNPIGAAISQGQPAQEPKPVVQRFSNVPVAKPDSKGWVPAK
jgi:hypothetical protein